MCRDFVYICLTEILNRSHILEVFNHHIPILYYLAYYADVLNNY